MNISQKHLNSSFTRPHNGPPLKSPAIQTCQMCSNNKENKVSVAHCTYTAAAHSVQANKAAEKQRHYPSQNSQATSGCALHRRPSTAT